VSSGVAGQWLPDVLVALFAPVLLKPLLALAADPAACEVDEQIAVTVAHVVAALDVGVELALGVDADVVAHELVLEHQVLEGVLLGARVLLAHEHGVVGHHLEGPAGEGGAAEKGAARVDTLVVLCDEDVDFLDAEVLGGVDVGGVLLELAVEDWGVAHEAALEGGGGEDLVDEVVVGAHHDNVRVDEPDPLGVGVEVEGLGDGGDLGPCLGGGQRVACSLRALSRTHPVGLANVVAAGVEPQVGVAMLGAVLFAVVEDALQHVGDGAVVATAIAGRQHDNVPVARRAGVAVPAVGVLGHAPVPLGLRLEVAWLRAVVVVGDGGNGLAGPVVAVVLDGHVAVEAEEDDEDGEGRDGEDDGSARPPVSTCRDEGYYSVKQAAGVSACHFHSTLQATWRLGAEQSKAEQGRAGQSRTLHTMDSRRVGLCCCTHAHAEEGGQRRTFGASPGGSACWRGWGMSAASRLCRNGDAFRGAGDGWRRQAEEEK
jgi:hypothetical protein